MKAMNKITTKIAGVALATVMMLGGMTVFAAQPENQSVSTTLTVYAERSHALVYFDYYAVHKSIYVPEDGRYNITFTAERAGDYPKEMFLSSEYGNTITSVCGPWDTYTLENIHLEAGVEYDIRVYAEGFVGFTVFSDADSADFTVTATLVESDTLDIEDVIGFHQIIEEPEDDDVDPDIPSLPTIVIDAPEDEPTAFDLYVDLSDIDNDVENDTDTDLDTSNAAPLAVSLTPEQVRMLSVQNFVGHLYLEGLGRRATTAEMNYWTDKLMCCNITATEAASQILTSAELNEHDFDNEQMAAILNDVFDTESEDTLAQLNDGASIESVIEQLAGTDDWASKCAFYGVNV